MDNLIFESGADGAVLTGIGGAPVHAVIPETYCGHMVRAIGKYAFAQQKQLKSVSLPDGITSIGDHAFYNCRNLEKLVLSHGVSSIGDGAFKNCESLHDITMHGMRHLKHILSDFTHEITLTMTFEDGQTAVLLFPEYDYEYLENVPPREFRSVTYGSGAFYRMCISNSAVDFQQYDRTFRRAEREDASETVQNIAFYRLLYPYQLSEPHRTAYLAYLSKNISQVVKTVLELRSVPRLELLTECRLFDRDTLSQAIRLASEQDFPEAVSILMDHQLTHFDRCRKRFVL